MSLVPSGKNFEPFASPVNSRRHSVIGLGEGPQVIRTPKKSGLASQIEEDEEEEEHVVIEAVDGEEGDVLYVESREEEEEFKVGQPRRVITYAENVARSQQPIHDTTAETKGANAKHQCRSSNQSHAERFGVPRRDSSSGRGQWLCFTTYPSIGPTSAHCRYPVRIRRKYPCPRRQDPSLSSLTTG